MPRGRLRSWNDNALGDAVAVSGSLTGVVRTLGLRPAGGNHASVRAHILRLGLDTSHFSRTRRVPGVVASAHGRRMELGRVFCSASVANRTTLRLRAREYLAPYLCAGCGNPGLHRGQPLALQLDHKNGIADDNRLTNLRWLCPNCHSQTDTFCGRTRSARDRAQALGKRFPQP